MPPRWTLTEFAIRRGAHALRCSVDAAEDRLYELMPTATYRETDRQGRELWRSPKSAHGLRWVLDDARPGPGGQSPRVVWVGQGAPPAEHWDPAPQPGMAPTPPSRAPADYSGMSPTDRACQVLLDAVAAIQHLVPQTVRDAAIEAEDALAAKYAPRDPDGRPREEPVTVHLDPGARRILDELAQADGGNRGATLGRALRLLYDQRRPHAPRR